MCTADCRPVWLSSCRPAVEPSARPCLGTGAQLAKPKNSGAKSGLAGFTVGGCSGKLLPQVPYAAVAARALLVPCSGPSGRLDCVRLWPSRRGDSAPAAFAGAACAFIMSKEVAGQPEGKMLLEAIEAGSVPYSEKMGYVRWFKSSSKRVTGCLLLPTKRSLSGGR